MRPISAATRLMASSYGSGLNPDARGRVPPQRRRQPIGMRALQVALHAFRTEHAAIEREVLPRLEADHLVPAHLELNPALLPAEAAMRLHEPIRLDAGRQPHARHRGQVRSEPFDDAKGIDRNFSHAGYPASRCPSKPPGVGRSDIAATTPPAPDRRARGGTSGRRPGSARRRATRSESRAPARRS